MEEEAVVLHWQLCVAGELSERCLVAQNIQSSKNLGLGLHKENIVIHVKSWGDTPFPVDKHVGEVIYLLESKPEEAPKVRPTIPSW